MGLAVLLDQFHCMLNDCGCSGVYSEVFYILQVLSTHKLMLVTYEEFENEVSWHGKSMHCLWVVVTVLCIARCLIADSWALITTYTVNYNNWIMYAYVFEILSHILKHT